MSIEIIVPDIGEGKFPIIEILVATGETVANEDGLVVLESDKATMEVPAPADGVIASLTVALGDSIGTGDVIGTLTVADGEKGPATSPVQGAEDSASVSDVQSAVAGKDSSPPPKTTTATQQPKVVAPAVDAHADSIDETAFRLAHASPSIRKLARELGVDLGKVAGSGRKGRITSDDIKQFVKSAITRSESAPGAGGAGIPTIPVPDFSQFGEVQTLKLSRINVLTGEHMTRCWLNIPHVTQYDEADITDLEVFRKSLKSEAEKRGVRVTLLSFLMKALVNAMKAYPKFNASLSSDGQSLIMKQYFHIGIAVDTPNGLVVPVIRDVDKKSIYQLSEDLMTMSQKARDGKLTPADMSGGCMTISSLGGIGGTAFTPIVNAPEVAILGVSRAKMMPVWQADEFVPRNILPLSLSYDHRVIDGADGARFTQHLSALLSDARRMLL